MGPPPIPCPRCDFPVEYEQDSCPRCAEERRNRLHARLKNAGIGAAVVLCLAVWQHQALLTAWVDFMTEVEYARYPALRRERAQAEAAAAAMARTPAPSPAPAMAHIEIPPIVIAPAPPPVVTHAPAPAHAPVAKPKPADPVEPAAPPVANATAPPMPAAPTEHRRRFYGVVYDIATLKPVAGAKLLFRMHGAENGWPATTDQFGHYQLDLVKATVDMPMVVAVSPLAGYREGQLEDTDPPLRERPRSVRKRLLEETTDNDLEPVPLRYQSGADIVPLDLVLLPAKQKVTQ